MMSIDDTTKVKIWQDMYKQAAWERDVAIKQLEQLGYEFGEKIEPNQFRDTTKKTDDDTISRAAAIDAVSDACFELRGVFGRCEDALKALPSAQLECKMGHWIYEERKRLVDETDDGPVYRTEKWWSCSECGYAKGYWISKPSSNYCENCGAKMLKDGE